MTQEPVSLDELIAAREALITIIVDDMPTAHREFLIGFKSGEPDWDLIGLPGIADLPAVRWKQRKLDQLAPDRRDHLVEGLRAVWPSYGGAATGTTTPGQRLPDRPDRRVTAPPAAPDIKRPRRRSASPGVAMSAIHQEPA